MTTKTINGLLHQALEVGDRLVSGDLFLNDDGRWIKTSDAGLSVYLDCPRTYWRALEKRPKEIKTAYKRFNGVGYERVYSGATRFDDMFRDADGIWNRAGICVPIKPHDIVYRRIEGKAMKNRIETKQIYALTDPCCNALAEDFREGLFTVSDGQLTIMVGPRQLTMHLAYCPFCGTEISPCE